MESPLAPKKSYRLRFKRVKAVSGPLHLIWVFCTVVSLVWLAPRLGAKDRIQTNQEANERIKQRQLLLEALDKYARYESYYREVHGRFTRELARVALPENFASGSKSDLMRAYEVSVLDSMPNRFVLLATSVDGRERVTIDENHRLRANFVLPPPAKAYLLEEADRLLRLKMAGVKPIEGLFGRYWRLEPADSGEDWVAQGVRAPVLGEKRIVSLQQRGLASLFTAVGDQLKQQIGGYPKKREGSAINWSQSDPPTYQVDLDAKAVQEWLEAARLAQHIHRRERGHFADRWEELDLVSDYKFSDRLRFAKNIRVNPILVDGEGYRLVIEGTSGDLMGEQFVLDQNGGVKQVRYTEALINQLQATTELLENFQVKPLVDDRNRP